MAYPLAHLGSHPSGSEILWAAWRFDPWVLVGISLGLLLYFIWARRWDKQARLFAAGNLVLLVALVSPIAGIGEESLFSVHMLQHLLLEAVAVPLMILGIPKDLLRPALRWPPFRKLAAILGEPILAWSIGVGTMWLWHLPILFNAALEHRWIHALQHLCLVVSATVFWCAVFYPVERFRLKPFGAILYLFSACLAHSLLAALITFAPPGIYDFYLQPADPAAAWVRRHWGIDAALDQQIGGAFLWVMGCFLFMLFILGVLARYYRQPEKDLPRINPGVEGQLR